MKRKLYKQKGFFIRIISMLVLIGFTASFYAIFLTKNVNQKTISVLSEISAQNTNALSLEINNNLKTITNISKTLNCIDCRSMEEIQDFLKKIKANYEYLRLGVGDVNGNTLTTDDHDYNISHRQYFQSTLKGEATVSNTIKDMVDDSYTMVFSAPLIFDNEVKYVVFATYTIDKYVEVLSTPSFKGEGYSYVLDSDGNCIVGSNHESSFGLYFDNIYDEMMKASPKNEKPVASLKDKLKKNEYGDIVFLNKIKKNVYFQPLGIKDWHLLTVVPSSIVMHETNIMLIASYMFICLCVVIFILLVKNSSNIMATSRKELERMAYVDNLTGGMSYTRFKLEAENLLKNYTYKKYAILILDVNNFQFINDVFGYTEGDKALIFLWETITNTIGKNDLCSRIFDDHFAVMLEYSEVSSIEKLLKSQFELIKKYNPDYGIYNMTVSVGIYLIDDLEMDIDSMLNRARIPQKRIKGHSSQSEYSIYDPKLRDELLNQKRLENTFDSAIKNKDFKVFYQPKYNVKTQKFDGGEALVRWLQPDGSFMPPIKFIPFFEKNGDIIELDIYVLNETCSHIKEWLDKGFDVSPISVNVSQAQLANENFVRDHIEIVRKHNIPLNLIELEFTESIFAENEKVLLNISNQLHKYGIKVHLDDFGSGYSSLNMLNIIQCDILKIDKRFIDDLEDNYKSQAIVSNVISLAHTLDLHVIAEGVETKKQYDLLHSMDCDTIQGYYCARPMPKNDYYEIVKTQKMAE